MGKILTKVFKFFFLRVHRTSKMQTVSNYKRLLKDGFVNAISSLRFKGEIVKM